jgi:hypothetical protein
MALKLKKVDAGLFEGKAGDKVRLGVSVAKVAGGVQANILSVTYNEVTVKKAPFELTVAAGVHGAVVVYVSEPLTQAVIEEVDAEDATNRQALIRQRFRPSGPSVTVVIRAS